MLSADSKANSTSTFDVKSGNKKFYSIKELPEHKFIKEGRLKEVFVEKSVLQKLVHPGVVKLHWTFKEKRKFHFVLEHG